ncbi:sugar ABC transporter substrate-binding protein [Georgenia sp. TF02-10]|uniref:ABC transporter substrate-binding protein n=1 Tax=Georgenia sp. TF02-10 TaxID=2917725 RepID=UPI001FA70B88|nr:sugar ABC transporter substrate-binding protein [Georgenia sp. TF02-10]UNX54831.1 sugar ABC transporter substrate-binding protein [Georgenia sp. TF02-10]
MMNRRTGVAAAAVNASLVLAACGGGGGGQGGTEQLTGDAENPINLEFQSLAWQEASIEANRAIVEEWNAQNPGIQVEYVQGDWGSVHDQLLTSFEGGDPPDIIHYEAAAGQVFAEGGYYADLEGLLSDEFKAGIPDDIWEAVQVEGAGTVGAPFLLESRVPFANAAMLEEAGIEVPTPEDPWTWDDFQDAAQQLTTDGRYGLSWPLASPAMAMLSLSMSFGGDYVDGEGQDARVSVGEAELEVPTRIHSMLYAEQTIDPDSMGVSATDALPAFFAGETAMLFGAIWLRQQMVQQAPEDFQWVTLPPLEGSDGSAQSGNPQTLSIAAQSENQEAAAQFIEFFLNDENMAQLALGDWLVPTSEGALEVLSEQTGGEQGWDVAIASVDSLRAAPWQQLAGFEEWRDRTATPAFQRYFADEISAEELAQQLEAGGADIGR